MSRAGITTRVACAGPAACVGSALAPGDPLGASLADGDGASIDAEGSGDSSMAVGDWSGTVPAVVGSAYDRRPAVISRTPSAVRSAGSRRVRMADSAEEGRPDMAAEW